MCVGWARQLGRAGAETTAAITAQLAQALAANASLRELELGGNHLGWRACSELLEALANTTTLRCVGLSHNAMTVRNLSGFVQVRARPQFSPKLRHVATTLVSVGTWWVPHCVRRYYSTTRLWRLWTCPTTSCWRTCMPPRR